MVSSVATITLRGNTASNGSGSNLPVNEAVEITVKAGGTSVTTTNGSIADTMETGGGAGGGIFTIRMNCNNSVRNEYLVDSCYCWSGVGTSRVSASGHIGLTMNSLQLVPATGTMTGSWYAEYY